MVRILADSTCDLSRELIEKYNITILPLHVLLGEQDCRDGVDVDADGVYKWSDENNTTPKTAAPSPQEAVDCLQEVMKDGDEAICFSISSSMSASHSVMKLASEELEVADRVYCFDSGNLSTGIGLLVIEAAIMAQDGKNLKEIEAHLTEIRPLVRSSFVVDTLTYLHRGGRCSGVTALAGSILKIHPQINVVDGKMEVGKKYRGKMPKVILEYAKDMEESLKAAKHDRVFITHSGCSQEVLDQVYQYLEGLGLFKEILVTRAGCVISSHCGPGTLGVLYIA